MTARVPIIGCAVVLLALTSACSSSSSQSAANGPPAYSLAKANGLLVTASEAGLPTWKLKSTHGQQESQTTLAIEYLSRTAYSPSVDVSLVVGHSEAVVTEAQALEAPSDKQDLRDPATSAITFPSGNGTVRATELSGYDTILKQRQVKVQFIRGPVWASVTGSDAELVEQVAKAEAAKLGTA